MEGRVTKELILPISRILHTSEGGDADYELVDQKRQWPSCLIAIRHAVSKGQTLALDCEGDSLSRKGNIQLLSLDTEEKTFILDIQKLKAFPFERGLREILEDKNLIKLMFDCREDADALFHQFHVTLDGVLDIQLLEENSINRKRGDHNFSAISLNSLLGCMKKYFQCEESVKQKEEGMRLEKEWTNRPLTAKQISYAQIDVYLLDWLFDNFKPSDEELARLKIASRIYLNLKRFIPCRKYNEYENNTYLPVDVIPDKGSSSFPKGYVSCTECYRQFPEDEFSIRQVKKKNQMCRTCKKVKNDKSVQLTEYQFEYFDNDDVTESAERENEIKQYQEQCDEEERYFSEVLNQ
ncbi:EXD1-like protein [Mya arenaria]|uniref:EXD1-like protein n=1 Tax=Mya arenaria TaxID=6604 RepID=A0ABY7FPI5_MYAAR|nr:EXD1-like protein [Mya arenaria]